MHDNSLSQKARRIGRLQHAVRDAIRYGVVFALTASGVDAADSLREPTTQIVDRAHIESSGHTSLGDLLQDLPIAGGALNAQFNRLGNGDTYVDLRNMGANRVLVLLNGRRLAETIGGEVDLSAIPLSIVERIEIATGSRSAQYGTGAIAGVVNIVSRNDLEGALFAAQFGQFASEDDGETETADFSLGRRSERGSAFFSVSYRKTDPVFAGNRAISAEPRFGTGTSVGSDATPQGRLGAEFLGSLSLTTDPGADVAELGAAAFRPGDYSSFVQGSGRDRYNYAPESYLLTPQERTSVFFSGAYDISDNAQVYADALYANRTSSQRFAPFPLYLGWFGGGIAAEIGVGADHPFNPFGQALNASSWLLGRRLIEAGPRIFSQDVDTYRFSVGAAGRLEMADRSFDWDVSYTFGEVRTTDRSRGLVDMRRVRDALTDGCAADPACVPLNVFGGIPGNTSPRAGDPGSITPEMLNFIAFSGEGRRGSELDQVSIRFSHDAYELPGGMVRLDAGYEHRRVKGNIRPDAGLQEGVTGAPPEPVTRGNTSTDDFFLGVDIPLVDTGSASLNAGITARWSDIKPVGDVSSIDIDVIWQPTDDLRFLARYSEGFRSPSVEDAFAGAVETSTIYSDPCSDFFGVNDPYAAQPQYIIDNCIAQGVPADGSYTQIGGYTVAGTTGGNPRLLPEQSNTVSLGIAVDTSPTSSINLEFYRTRIERIPALVTAQETVEACALRLELCDFFERSPRLGNIRFFRLGLANTDTKTVEGADVGLSIGSSSRSWGEVRADWNISYQRSHEVGMRNHSSGESETTGILGTFQDTVVPRWKSGLLVHWNKSAWRAVWNVQYIHRTVEACWVSPEFGFCNLDRDGDGGNESRALGSTTYHDLQFGYQFSTIPLDVSLGVHNAFDKNPPLSTKVFANSFSVADYRTPGRFVYAQLKYAL